MKVKVILSFVFILLFTISCGTVNNNDSNNNNLVAYYPFSGNAFDHSIQKNNGIVNGAELTTDRFGNKNSAYYFNGIDDYILIPDDNSLSPSNQQLTIALWVNVSNLTDRYFIYKGSDQYNREYAMGITINSLASMHINNQGMWNTGQIGLASNSIIKSGEWFFLVGTWNGKELKLYVNGSLENTLKTTAVIDNFDSDLFIGTYGGDISKYAFKGIIDDIRIYNYSIDSQKVLKLYHENGWK